MENVEEVSIAHVETLIGGLLDKYNGVESYATRYMEGVMWSDKENYYRVSGTEGLVGAVGAGVKAVWEYIKKMFAKIKAYFSSGDAEQKANKAKKDGESLSKTIHINTLFPKDRAMANKVYPKLIEKLRASDLPEFKAFLNKLEQAKDGLAKDQLQDLSTFYHDFFKRELTEIPFPGKQVRQMLLEGVNALRHRKAAYDESGIRNTFLDSIMNELGKIAHDAGMFLFFFQKDETIAIHTLPELLVDSQKMLTVSIERIREIKKWVGGIDGDIRKLDAKVSSGDISEAEQKTLNELKATLGSVGSISSSVTILISGIQQIYKQFRFLE